MAHLSKAKRAVLGGLFVLGLMTGYANAHNTHCCVNSWGHGLGDGQDYDNHIHPYNEHYDTSGPHRNYIGWGYIQLGIQFDKWATVHHNHYDYDPGPNALYSELYAFSKHESEGAADHNMYRHKHCHHDNYDNFCP